MGLIIFVRALYILFYIPGLCGLIGMLSDPIKYGWMWITSFVLSIVGLIFGIKHWDIDASPRLIRKSKGEIFDTRIGIAFSYAFLFFLIVPGAWADWYIIKGIIYIYNITIGSDL